MSKTVHIAVSLSLLLTCAHFLRGGGYGMAAGLALLAGLVIADKDWARVPAALCLLFGAFVWAGTFSDLVGIRMAAGALWLRVGVIIGAVLALDLAALALVTLKFPRDGLSRAKGAAFAGTIALLYLAREKTPLAILLADRFLPGWGGVEIFLLGVYAAWITGLMLDPARQPTVRGRIWGLFSLVFFGQAALGIAGVPQMLMTGHLHLPVPALILAGPLYRGEGFFMLILYGASLLVVGPAWCSHLCYIGAWDHWSSSAKGRITSLPPYAKYIRAGLLALVLAAALGLRFSGVSTLVSVWSGALFGLAGVAVMLVLSRRKGTMVHCTAYCPIGICSNVLGKINPWRVRIGAGCEKCGKCSRACRYSALLKEDLERGRPGLSCTLCGDCVASCPDKRLHYAFPGLSPIAARTAFIVTAVILHAVFLGVARI